MFDEDYVQEILRAAKVQRPADRSAFRAMCRRDINACYGVEVEEAWRRYSAGRAIARKCKKEE